MSGAQTRIQWSPTETCSRKVQQLSQPCLHNLVSLDAKLISLYNVLHRDCGLYSPSVCQAFYSFVIVSSYPRWQQEPNEIKPKLTFQAERNSSRNSQEKRATIGSVLRAVPQGWSAGATAKQSNSHSVEDGDVRRHPDNYLPQGCSTLAATKGSGSCLC